MTDQEAPTPRLSSVWQMQLGLAQALSDRLRAAEAACSRMGPGLNTRRARELKALRTLADSYAARFARWPIDGADIGSKARDHREWGLCMALALAVLE